MKKFWQHLLVLLVVTGLGVVACVPQGATPTTTAETMTLTRPPATATPTHQPIPNSPEFDVDPGALSELQIQFMHPWTGSALDELISLVDEFNQTNEWGIHVIMSAPGSAAMVTSKTLEGIANNQPPNVLAAAPGFILAIDERDGLVLDLTSYVDSGGYGLTANEVADFYPLFWEELIVNEKRIGIPAQQSALLLAYNKARAKELGFLQAPATAEEFKAQMCASNAAYLKDDDTTNDGLGGWLINTDPVALFSWLSAFGVEPRSDEGYTFSGEAGEKAFTYLLELKNESCAWVGRSSQDAAYFANRQALAIAVWMQDLPALTREMERVNPEDDWTLIPFPGSEGQVVTTAGTAYAVLSNEPAEDLAAWLFIRWLSQPEQQARLLTNFGTLPLSSTAEDTVDQNAFSPQRKHALEHSDVLILQPVDADWMVVSQVLEDAGWQLLKTEITAEQIPGLLKELGDIATDLAGRYP